MSKFNQYIIVSDMDGTFFGANATVLPQNVEAIRYFCENGGMFTLGTGRDYRVLTKQYPQLVEYLSCPAILCNGSYLYDFQKNEKFFEIALDQEECLSVISYINSIVTDATYRISCDIGFLCPHDRPVPFSDRIISLFSDIITSGKLEEYRHIPWHKLVYSANGSKGATSDGLGKVENNFIPQITALLENVSLKNISVTTSSPTLLELMPKSASKGQALTKLKSLYPGRRAICVGDYLNDLDMLQAADIAACPDNALDQIKSICSIHLCNHQEGCIADLIYKLDSNIKE